MKGFTYLNRFIGERLKNMEEEKMKKSIIAVLAAVMVITGISAVTVSAHGGHHRNVCEHGCYYGSCVSENCPYNNEYCNGTGRYYGGCRGSHHCYR